MLRAEWTHSMNERLFATIFLIFGIVMVFWIIPVGIPVAFVPPRQIGPQFWPVVLSVAITVVAALILLTPVLRRIRGRPTHPRPSSQASIDEHKQGAPAEHSHEKRAEDGFRRLAPWLTIAIIGLYFLLLAWVGFIVSSAFAIAATMLVFGDRRWWTIVILSLAVPFLMWAFAVKLLHIPIS
jgi:hypothetical protein